MERKSVLLLVVVSNDLRTDRRSVSPAAQRHALITVDHSTYEYDPTLSAHPDSSYCSRSIILDYSKEWPLYRHWGSTIMSSKKRGASEKEPKEEKQKLRRVAGLFAPGILQRHLESGRPLSLIPLRSPGLRRGLEDNTNDKRQCICSKTACLKLYCDCFSSSMLCGAECRCDSSCRNNERTEENRLARNKAILNFVQKDPTAFRIRTGSRKRGEKAISCACKQNQCNTKYCICVRNGLSCGSTCKCQSCYNTGMSSGATKAKPSETGEKMPTTFMLGKNMRPFFMPGVAFQDTSTELIGKSNIPTVARGQGAKSTKTLSTHELFAERVLGEMDKQLRGGKEPRKESGSTTDVIARNIISKVQEYVEQMLGAANDAEQEMRQQLDNRRVIPTAAASTSTVDRARLDHPYLYQIIPVGTRFKQTFDFLGSFEGVVTSVPDERNPFYVVEYEDGGSESLLHHSLVEILGKGELEHGRSPALAQLSGLQPFATQTVDGATEDGNKKMEDKIHSAREIAYQQACIEIIRVRRLANGGVDTL